MAYRIAAAAEFEVNVVKGAEEMPAGIFLGAGRSTTVFASIWVVGGGKQVGRLQDVLFVLLCHLYLCFSHIPVLESRMATANLANSPITQVSQTPVQTNLQPQLLTRLLLDLRGKRFSVDRDTIMNLPESVLLCLFPNGLVLSRQSAALSDGGDNDDLEELYGVDVRIVLLF